MAIRVPKLLTDLTAAAPQRTVALSALGIYAGSSAPAESVTVEEWLASGSGYWLWIQTPASDLVSVAPSALTLSLGADAPAVSFPAWRVDVNPPAGALALSAEVPTVSVIAPDVVEVAAPSVALSLASAAPSVSIVEPSVVTVSPPTAALAITAGAPAVSTPTWRVSVAPPTAALVMTAAAPTVSIEAGASTSVSDDFNRANGALGSNWTAPTGMTAPTIVSNMARHSGAGAGVAYWSGRVFAANQYAECVVDLATGGGIRVRQSASANTAYYASVALDEEIGNHIQVGRVVAGAAVVMATPTWIGGKIRLEIEGTTLRVKEFGTAWTTLYTGTTNHIADGAPALNLGNGCGNDSFAAGDI